jgi:hypothetical protein
MHTLGGGEEAEGLQRSVGEEGGAELAHAMRRLEGTFFGTVVLRRAVAGFAPWELG